MVHEQKKKECLHAVVWGGGVCIIYIFSPNKKKLCISNSKRQEERESEDL